MRTNHEYAARQIRSLPQRRGGTDRLPEFTLSDVYAHEAALAALYPGNHNVRPKIRQQLQVLRDRGWLEFNGRGTYQRT